MLDEDRYWEPTCRALGLEELIEQFPDGATRSANRERIYDQISSAITAGTHAAVDAALRAEGCIFSFYASPDEVLADEAASANGYAVPHPTHPTLRLSAAPAQFDDELPAIRRPAPTIGEHTREILTELGYTADEITRFGDDGALATE
jgi:crotonobetainyl-CoA:carnitine CoA-transferase CaiB-like acyl-CoA transferase